MSVKFLGAIRDGMRYYNATEILNQGLEKENGFHLWIDLPDGTQFIVPKGSKLSSCNYSIVTDAIKDDDTFIMYWFLLKLKGGDKINIPDSISLYTAISRMKEGNIRVTEGYELLRQKSYEVQEALSKGEKVDMQELFDWFLNWKGVIKLDYLKSLY